MSERPQEKPRSQNDLAGPGESRLHIDPTQGEDSNLEQIVETMGHLRGVHAEIGILLDRHRLVGSLSQEHREQISQLLDEEDVLRDQLTNLGGPSWESSRRWWK